MAEIEDGAISSRARLSPTTAALIAQFLPDLDQQRLVAPHQLREFPPATRRARTRDGGVFDDLGHPRFTSRPGRVFNIRVVDHTRGWWKAPIRFLPPGWLTAVLPPTRGRPGPTGWSAPAPADAALEGGGGESGDVADHAAAQRDGRVAIHPVGDQRVEHQPAVSGSCAARRPAGCSRRCAAAQSCRSISQDTAWQPWCWSRSEDRGRESAHPAARDPPAIRNRS